ncbi:MAG: alpha/beta fold hydrolase [Sphingomonadaceae bacterium]
MIVYLHGTPGSPRELAYFAPHRADIYAPDRFALGLDHDQLAAHLTARFSGEPLHLIGFSMGSFVAMQVAHRLGAQVVKLDLISAVAPFEAGDYLNDAVGGPLFRLAASRSWLFEFAVWLQKMMAHYAPSLLFHFLFAKSRGGDAELARDPSFKRNVSAILVSSLGTGSARYAQELRAVMQPWADIIPTIAAPATLWHGSDDNWSPPAMADYLARNLGNVVADHRREGGSHYSVLRDALGVICREG